MESSTNQDESDSTLRRPMNAFLLFCKRHRSVVKSGHPWLDNRSCTKMLADMWAVLDWDEKSKYLQLARECKVAFMKAHPDYKWCGSNKQNVKANSSTMKTRTKSPSRHLHNPSGRVRAQDNSSNQSTLLASSRISPGKLADPCDMGGLSLLLLAGEQSMSKPMVASCHTPGTPASPKSRLFEFAEMCSDQLDLKYMPDQSSSRNPSKVCSATHKTKCIHQNETGYQTEKDGVTKTHKLALRDDPQRGNHERFCIDTPELNNNNSLDAVNIHERTQKVGKKMSATNNPSKDRKLIKLELSNLNSCNHEDMQGSSVQCGSDGVQSSEDLMDRPSSSDGGDWGEEQGTRRTSSRSCKGRLYREFVMEGMLESLQKPERPFNCKKTWKQMDGSSLSDGDDVVFQPSPDKPKRASRRNTRKRTVSGCGSLPTSADFDYGEIDVEARLASLPQYSPQQFKPQSKSHHLKKSTLLYKNSTFVKKEAKATHHRHNSKDQALDLCGSGQTTVAGSRKRKAPKSSILHLTAYQMKKSSKDASDTASNTRLFIMDTQRINKDRATSTDSVSPTGVALDETAQNTFSMDDTFKVSPEDTKSFPSPRMSESHQLPRSTSHVISAAASSLHRSVLTVS